MRKIKSITAYTSFIGEEGLPENEYKSSYKKFDHNQNLIQHIVYTRDGEWETGIDRDFNEANLLLQEVYYLNDTDVGERIVYRYDDQDELLEKETTYADGSQSIRISSTQGLLQSITVVNEQGKREGEELRKYDARGNVLEEVIYDENKKVRQKRVHTYDAENQLISTTKWEENESFVVKMVFEYDEQKRISRETHYDKRGNQLTEITSEYTAQGQLVSQKEENKYVIKRSYDDAGRLIKNETLTLPKEMTESLKIYQYDEDNLLIEKTFFEMGQQYEIEPNVVGRTASTFTRTRFRYEFYF